MLENDCKLMYEPFEMVRKSGRLPKTLPFKDELKQEYYFEPQIVGEDMLTAQIFYELPMKFARELLTDDRYKLIRPERMVVPVRGSFNQRTRIVNATKIKENIAPALSDTQIENLRVESEIKRQEAEDEMTAGKVPKFMKESVDSLEKKNKIEEKNTAKRIAAEKKKKTEL